MNNLIDYYFKEQKYYENIYGSKTLFMMQVGGFYEMYETLSDGPDLNKIGNLLNILVSKRNKNITSVDKKNPKMSGFPLAVINKYLKILIDNSYTVIICSQTTPPPNPKREITGIYSPSTYIEDINNPDNNYLLCIYIEEIQDIKTLKSNYMCGLALTDLSTGRSIVNEIYSEYQDDKLSLDEVVKFINIYNPKEILLISDVKTISKENLELYLEIKDKNYLHKTINDLINIKGYKNIKNIAFQQELLKKVYPQINILTPIEYLNFERLEYLRLAFIILIQYAFEHNSNIINNLELPDIYEKEKTLHLGNNAIYQLNIFRFDMNQEQNNSIKSLFDVINKTSTSIGRRYLKNIVSAPLINHDELKYRYNIIEYLLNNKITNEIDKILNEICDIERLERKMCLLTIHPMELYNWINAQKKINELLKLIKFDDLKQKLNYDINELYLSHCQMLNHLETIFNINELSKYLMNEISGNIFLESVYSDIDNIQEELKICSNFMESLAIKLGSMIEDNKQSKNKDLIKVESNDRDGHFLVLTKRRADLLQKVLKNEDKIYIKKLEIETNKLIFKHAIKGNSKIFLPELEKNSDQIVNLTNKLKLLIKTYYLEEIKKININPKIINLIAFIDFCKSGALVAKKNNYCKPEIVESEKSFITCKQLRHPIVEKININSEYVPVDISLGKDNCDGILLFGLNSAGKSTLQKALGISIILAQIGYFVPAKEFKYYPYNSIFTRISSNDNLFKGLSSFTLELTELRSILKRSGQNTLVIADEVCKGTEHTSSLIIVMTMIEMLSKSKTSFISATHLHELTNLKRLNKLKNVKLYHLHVEFNNINNTLIYDRTLKEGSGTSFYGYEVAKYLMNDQEFIYIASEIHKEIGGDILISHKKSKYNSNVHMTKCQICNKIPKEGEIPLETHHIEFQKNCDENGFILKKQHKHKNHKTNLVVLCSICHDKIDTKELFINGYDNTSHGPKLIYEII
jgi:DNA mismatch repair protein MutS